MEHMDMRYSSSEARASWSQGLEAPPRTRPCAVWAEDPHSASVRDPAQGDDSSSCPPYQRVAALSPEIGSLVYPHLAGVAAEALLAFDEQGRVMCANQACAALLGRATESLPGVKVESLFGPHSPLCAPPRAGLENAPEGWGTEWEWLTPQGQVVPLAVTCREVGSIEGRGAVYVASLQDLSGVRLLEERLRESQKFEAIGGLAAGIVHDLKSFLAGILGCARFLMAELDETHAHYAELKSIAETANTAIDLANRLLALTRRDPSQMLVCSLNHLVEKTAAVLQRSVAQNVCLRLELSEELPSVLCNPSQIEQVLMNLGINGADAMPEGGELVFRTGVVELDEESWRPTAHLRPGRYVYFSVQDTGMGIPPNLQRKIFEPLFTTKQPGKGTGMGLAVAESIVREHRGMITVDSRVGVGSRFTVYLPVAIEDQAEPVALEAVKA